MWGVGRSSKRRDIFIQNKHIIPVVTRTQPSLLFGFCNINYATVPVPVQKGVTTVQVLYFVL